MGLQPLVAVSALLADLLHNHAHFILNNLVLVDVRLLLELIELSEYLVVTVNEISVAVVVY